MEGPDTYLIRPNYQHKFKPAVVKECIRETVKARLSEVQYDPDEVSELTRTLADCVKNKVKNLGFHRYKFVVQVTIGEQRGQGVKSGQPTKITPRGQRWLIEEVTEEIRTTQELQFS
ncbi:dynein light chain Tctex-type protein 2B isoform X2 [Phycodurus eques]|uniref:dynein light chain Tctex-type protein 2B isoform X2 n=1 Tax=Phycodurus eques TaxID=693459 RepID=UPI002ACD87D1|nr:dynein light chain Tctex-type protein 2B isoform X2 [Phycodurus eques]